MIIDGKEIAKSILKDLEERVATLKKKGITPHLVIILVGHDPASEAYVRQKKRKGKDIGTLVTAIRKESGIGNQELGEIIKKLNRDTRVHGVIVQRPLPSHIDSAAIDLVVDPKKDVDGFHPNTKFEMPISLAVIKTLEHIYYSENKSGNNFTPWLRTKKVIVIGKGKTGGGPIIKMLQSKGVKPFIVDTKTVNHERITKNADILISAVGKPNVVRPTMIKKGTMLISVGLHREKDGKLHGDYEEDSIKHIASYYTPTPGGIGPLNVAMLLQNLIFASEGR